MINKLGYIFLSTCLLISFSLTRPDFAAATVEVGDVASSGRTYINYFANHNYLPKDRTLLYAYSVRALEKIRQRLVAEGKLDNIPVIFNIPSDVFPLDSPNTTIKKTTSCRLGYGDTSADPAAPEIENCYYIYFVGKPDFRTFLALLVSTAQLSPPKLSQDIPDLESLSVGLGSTLAPYLGTSYYSQPVWSPDSRFTVFGVWQDGVYSGEIYDVQADSYTSLPALDGNVAVEPVWSPDSRYLVFASLSQIQSFDTNTKATQAINISSQTNGKNYDLLISFSPSENLILYAFDTNLLAGYQIYEFHPRAVDPILRAGDVSSINWEPGYFGQSQTSPDGRYEARTDLTSRSVKSLSPASPPPQSTPTQVPSPTDLPPRNNFPWLFVAAVAGIVFFATGWLLGSRKSRLTNAT